MHDTADVVIVGGGVIGCSISYQLARAGASVTLLERGEIGSQASAAATGMLAPLKPFAKLDAYLALQLASCGLFPALVEELEGETGLSVSFERTGTLRLLPAKQLSRVLAWAGSWCDERYHPQVLLAEALGEREPLLAGHSGPALYIPEEAQLRAPQLVRAYAWAATSRGARLLEGCEVTDLRHVDGRVQEVITADGRAIGCGTLVIATGAWSASLGTLLGLTLPVRPQRGQCFSLQQPATPLRHLIFGEGIYLAPKRGGTIIVGATHEDDVAFDSATTPEGIERLRGGMTRLFPALDACAMTAQWAGLRPKTPDSRPILGPAHPWQNVTLAVGHNGFGILLSAISGVLVRDLLTGGQIPTVMRPFLLERFGGSATAA
jgi:glycine oxidase